MGEESDKASLEGAETTFDLAFGLWCGSHKMSDTKGAQGALELALGVAVIVA